MRIPSTLHLLSAAVLGALGACAYSLLHGDRGGAPAAQPEEERPQPVRLYRVAPPEVRFADVTESAGIRFRHFNGASGPKLLPEIMGAGVAVLDFDRDGQPDLFFVNSCSWPGCPKSEGGSQLCLYRNKGDGTFEDVSAAVGLALTVYGIGVAVGDIDNDGYPDVFVTALGGNHLFLNVAGNNGKRRFKDIATEAGVRGPTVWPDVSAEEFFRFNESIPFPTSATFVDYDGDGKLDLFVCYYVDWSPARDLAVDIRPSIGAERTYPYPDFFPGTQCVLFRNVDGAHFEDVSAEAGIRVFGKPAGQDPKPESPMAKSLGVIVFDPDEDGWPDIAVANDSDRNFFFHNVPGPDGGRRFEQIAPLTNMVSNFGAMGIDWGEYEPGKTALLIANYANYPYNFLVLDDPNHLFFTDLGVTCGLDVTRPELVKFGTFFFDYDLDGRLDILTCSGSVGMSTKSQQPTTLFWNTGRKPGVFEMVSAASCGEELLRPIVGRGSAYLDFDGDGDLDVVLTVNNGPARLFRNDNSLKNHWVRLELIGDGTRSSRDAIGAHVMVEAKGAVQRRYVAGARGYLSQSEHVMTIGLGSSERVDRIVVRWPGKEAKNIQEWRGLAANRSYELRQGQPRAVPVAR